MIALQIYSSTDKRKNYPYYRELIERLDGEIVAVGNAVEHYPALTIIGHKAKNYCGIGLIKTLDLIKKADLFIGNDSGLTVSAYYLGVPTIQIYREGMTGDIARTKLKHFLIEPTVEEILNEICKIYPNGSGVINNPQKYGYMRKKLKYKWLYNDLYKKNFLIFVGNPDDFVSFAKHNNFELDRPTSAGRSYGIPDYGYIIYLRSFKKTPQDFSILFHEIIHTGLFLMDDIDMKINGENSEPLTYLCEWIAKKFLEGLK